jgi:hypothetical protein
MADATRTLRDQFAIAALHGLLTNAVPYPRLARDAYAIAAMMLAERKTPTSVPRAPVVTKTKTKTKTKK